MPILVIAPREVDMYSAKEFGLVPWEAKYLPDEEQCRGYKNATVYIVNWPGRWHRTNTNTSRSSLNRLYQLSRMQTYLRYSECEFIVVTLP